MNTCAFCAVASDEVRLLRAKRFIVFICDDCALSRPIAGEHDELPMFGVAPELKREIRRSHA